ncbi:MAG TPA: hypothetical protein VFD58_12100 [Blastocatellia bacterium]|nr:hypothetical protein [Blastocatellia bacterium]
MQLKRKSSRQIFRLAAAFALFQKSLRPGDTTDIVEQSDDGEPDFSHIRCPLCRWQPDASSLWYCGDCPSPEYFFDGCGTMWNTFETRGLCPGCGHQWRWTGCLSCAGWSLHEDWYTKETDKAL